MNFEITGNIIEIYKENQVNDKFRKQEFVIERNESANGFETTDYIKFQLTQNRTALIKSFNTGDMVRVWFNIRGNKWVNDGRINYFVNLDAWKIEPVAKAGEVNVASSHEYSTPDAVSADDPENEMPF
jgi:hypothetical protein